MKPIAQRVKVEILFDGPLAGAVTEIVTKAGAGGYTLFAALGGSGDNGVWSGDGVSAADTKRLLLTVVTEEAAEQIVRGLEPLLDSQGIIVVTSQVGVVRAAKF